MDRQVPSLRRPVLGQDVASRQIVSRRCCRRNSVRIHVQIMQLLQLKWTCVTERVYVTATTLHKYKGVKSVVFWVEDRLFAQFRNDTPTHLRAARMSPEPLQLRDRRGISRNRSPRAKRGTRTPTGSCRCVLLSSYLCSLWNHCNKYAFLVADSAADDQQLCETTAQSKRPQVRGLFQWPAGRR